MISQKTGACLLYQYFCAHITQDTSQNSGQKNSAGDQTWPNGQSIDIGSAVD